MADKIRDELVLRKSALKKTPEPTAGSRNAMGASSGTDFNYDYHVSFRPEAIASGAVVYNYEKTDMDMPDREGVSVFYTDDKGAVFHTYSSYARGIDMLNGAYHFLDLAPKGRDEDHLDFTQAWVRYHDRYED